MCILAGIGRKGLERTEMDLNLDRGGMRGVSHSDLLIGTRNSGRNGTKSTTLMIDTSLQTPVETNKRSKLGCSQSRLH